MDKISLLITDDHQLLRESLALVFESDNRFTVLGQCSTGEEAVQFARELKPAIVIMDINMAGINGIEASEQILKENPGIKILGLSNHTNPTYVRRMMKAGVSGYVTKDSDKEELFNALTQIAAGRKYISKDIKNNLSTEMLETDTTEKKKHPPSERELEIIEMVIKGMTSKEIAAKLQRSVKTIEGHRYNIRKKLNLHNIAAMISYVNEAAITQK